LLLESLVIRGTSDSPVSIEQSLRAFFGVASDTNCVSKVSFKCQSESRGLLLI
jgi:hypothetical protein